MEGVVKQQQQSVKVWWGRRMSQCEWAGARAMSRTGDVGRHGAPAWGPCRTHGLQLPQGKGKNHPRPGFTQNEKAEN